MIRLTFRLARALVLHPIARPIGVTLLLWCVVVLLAQQAGLQARDAVPCPPMVHESPNARPWMHR